MWHAFEDWQLNQLARVATIDQELIETSLNTLWRQAPGLFEQVVLSACSQGEIPAERAMAMLDLDEESLNYRLMMFRKSSVVVAGSAVVEAAGRPATLAGGSISVWEVVREYRKIGSIERLVESFPTLTTSELLAAVKYAANHPQEIEEQIAAYEETVARRRSRYPFAKSG